MKKPRPLSTHAIGCLRDIARAPVPSCEVNPGVIRRLFNDGFVVEVELPSPFKTVKGPVLHLRATPAGTEFLKSIEGRNEA